MTAFAERKPDAPTGNPLEDAPPNSPLIVQPPTRHAAEWGLASLILAGVLGVLAMLTLLAVAQIFFGPPIWARQDLRAIFWVSIVFVVLILGMTGAATAFGIVSLVSAVKRGQPLALGLAGLLLSIFVLLVWIFVLIDLFSVLDFLMRRQGHGGMF